MDKFSLSLSHWCSLKDGIQSGNCQLLASEERQQIDESAVLAGKKLRNIDPQTVNMLCCFVALLLCRVEPDYELGTACGNGQRHLNGGV